MQCAGLLLRGKFRSGQLHGCFVRFFFVYAGCARGVLLHWEKLFFRSRDQRRAVQTAGSVSLNVPGGKCQRGLRAVRFFFVYAGCARGVLLHWEKLFFRSRDQRRAVQTAGSASLNVPGGKCQRGLCAVRFFFVQNRCRDPVPRQRLFVCISLFRNAPAACFSIGRTHFSEAAISGVQFRRLGELR